MWSRGAVFSQTQFLGCLLGVLQGQRWGKGETEEEACSLYPIPSAPSDSASTALNSGFCLNCVLGEDSVAKAV